MKNTLMLFLTIGLIIHLTSCGKDDGIDASGDFDRVVVEVTNNCSSDLRFYFFDDFEDINTERSVGYVIAKGQTYLDTEDLIRTKFDYPVGIQVSDSIIVVKQYDENFQCSDKFKSTTEKKNMTLHAYYEFNDEYLREIYKSMVSRGIYPIKLK